MKHYLIRASFLIIDNFLNHTFKCNKMKKETIQEVEEETIRFMTKINEAKKRSDDALTYGCKESAALKRSALDLKRVLTKLTSPNPR